MSRLILVLCLAIAFPLFAQQTIESIPNNRLDNGSHVSNPDGVLSDAAVAQLDSILIDIERQTTAQVALVAVNSIGDAEIFDFAQKLFNTWGIGHKNDNGLLLLLVTDQRTIRFQTGSGLEGILTDVTCKRIQRDYMVTSFKDGDYEAGLIAGTQRVRELLTDPTSTEEVEYTEENVIPDYAAWMIFLTMFYGVPVLVIFGIKSVNGSFANSKNARRTSYNELRLNRGAWFIQYGLIPLLIALAFWPGPEADAPGWSFIALYLYFILTLVYRLYRERLVLNRFVAEEKYFEATEFVRSTQWFWFFMALLFPIPFLVYFFVHLTRKSHYRNHSRQCKVCNAAMKKLNEKEDDQYLGEKERFEEQLNSVDYDVWLCTSCQATREWAYLSRRRKYEPCPSCKTIAKYRKSRRTVKSATYSSSGKGEEIHECKFCKQTFVTAFTIPKLVMSTSSGSSSSSSGSSSSGSSWGGGSSSGGGASSSW
jgi:uncharacterized protein